MQHLKRLFTEHPASVGENYPQHLGSAWYFAWQMSLGAAACLLHGIFPFLFKTSASQRIGYLHDRMIMNRSRFSSSSSLSSPGVHGPARFAVRFTSWGRKPPH